MFGILEGLGPEYETFRTTMYCLKPQPEYDEVISQLERFETRLQTYSMNEYNSNLACIQLSKVRLIRIIGPAMVKDFDPIQIQ